MASPPGEPPSGRPPRRSDTRDPRWARQRAVKILFQADLRDVSVEQVLADLDDDVSARAMLDEVEADDLADAPDDGDASAALERVGRASVPDTGAAAIDGFTRTLVRGVLEHRTEIDELIARYARRWQISRMPVVDRTVLRLATYELLYEDTPPAVAIHEAVELAKGLSTGDSGRYVNGVLESVRKDVAARS